MWSVFQHLHASFLKKAKPTFDWASVLHNNSINWPLNVTLKLLNTFTHHLTETLVTYHIFVSISMPGSTFVLPMLSTFHSNFYSHYNQSYIFMKRHNCFTSHFFLQKFSLGHCLVFAYFWPHSATFSLVPLIKLLHI